MKIFHFLFLSILILSTAFAQDEDNTNYKISNLYHERAANFSCEYVQTAIEKIQAKSEHELKDELKQEVINLHQIGDSLQDENHKKDLETLSAKMQELANSSSPKSTLRAGLETLCKETTRPLVYLSRGLALTNSAVLNTIAFPFSGIVTFFRGVFSRNKSDLGPRNDFIYRAFGPRRNLHAYLLGVVASEASNFVLSNNPIFSALNASITIEMVTNYRCFYVNEENPDQVKFCKNYSKLKDFFHMGNVNIFKAGNNLQHLIDSHIIEKNDNLSNETFCRYSKKRQVKMAKHVLARHPELSNDPRISGIHVLLPIHKNSCTKILLYSKNIEELATLKVLEGIEVIKLKNDVFPSKQYFSQQDLKAMSFEDSLCYEAETVFYGQFLTNKSAMLGDLLKSALAPSMLALPATKKIIMDDENIRHGKISGLRNIIFSVGLNEKEERLASKLKEERKEIVKKIQNDYKKTISSGSFNRCHNVLNSRNVDLEEFKNDLARINEIAQEKALQKQLEYSVIEKYFRKQKKKLQLDWELIRSNNLQEITKTLRSSDVANVIIISHGKTSGHLVDSLDQELPREAFTDISPSIQSLNFYSCYSSKLIYLYSLNEKLKKLPSFYKIRYTTTVSENNFMGDENYAPIAAFDQYLSQVDIYLNNATKGAHLLQETYGQNFSDYESPKTCELDATDLIIKKGSYAITINDNLVGTVSEENSHSLFSFPCSFLKVVENNMKLKNIMNSGGSVFENLETFEMKIENSILPKASFLKNSLVIFKFDYNS